MNTNWMRRTLSTLGAAVTFSTLSFAQMGEMKGTVPFPFFATGVSLPAGDYSIKAVHGVNGRTVYAVRNVATKQSFFIGAFMTEKANASADTHPRLVFACGGENCWLQEFWPGDSNYLKMVKGSQAGTEHAVRLAVVSFDPKAGD